MGGDGEGDRGRRSNARGEDEATFERAPPVGRHGSKRDRHHPPHGGEGEEQPDGLLVEAPGGEPDRQKRQLDADGSEDPRKEKRQPQLETHGGTLQSLRRA